MQNPYRFQILKLQILTSASAMLFMECGLKQNVALQLARDLAIAALTNMGLDSDFSDLRFNEPIFFQQNPDVNFMCITYKRDLLAYIYENFSKDNLE